MKRLVFAFALALALMIAAYIALLFLVATSGHSTTF
jgi:hypothetical protein